MTKRAPLHNLCTLIEVPLGCILHSKGAFNSKAMNNSQDPNMEEALLRPDLELALAPYFCRDHGCLGQRGWLLSH